MGLYKAFKYLAFAVGGLGVAIFLYLLFKGDAEVITSESLQNSILNPFLLLTYFILIATVIVILIFVALRLFSGNVKNTLISLGAFVVVLVISLIAANGDSITYANGAHISGSGAKWMNAGLNMFYILAIVAVVALVLSSLKSLTFKK